MAHCAGADLATTTPAAAYPVNVKNWAEGTVTSLDANGRLVIRGLESPYAYSYFSALRDYYSAPPIERESRQRQLREKYRDSLNYSWSDENNDNFTLNVTYPEDVRVVDESKRYGSPFDTWAFTEKPMTSRYSDLQSGDRVVVGYNNNNFVDSIYRVNPIRRDAKPMMMNTQALGTVSQPPPANIDPTTGIHIMNLPSNATNRESGTKSGSDSGHIMNSGSNSTNAERRNPFISTDASIAPRP